MTGVFGGSSGWHHYKVAGKFQISNAWGIASNLMDWLGDNKFVLATYILESNANVESCAKTIQNMSNCTSVIFFYHTNKDIVYHSAINGTITYTNNKKDIAYYAHTSPKDGKTSSLKGHWGTYKYIYVLVISFSWGG